MTENYIAQCEEFQSACLGVRKQYRRGLVSEEDARKAFAQITASIFGCYTAIYNELNMQDFEPCFDDQGGACYEYLRV